MNQYDRDNLNFLMMASDEVLREWYNSASLDDLEYAQELLNAHECELDQEFSGGRSFSQVLQ